MDSPLFELGAASKRRLPTRVERPVSFSRDGVAMACPGLRTIKVYSTQTLDPLVAIPHENTPEHLDLNLEQQLLLVCDYRHATIIDLADQRIVRQVALAQRKLKRWGGRWMRFVDDRRGSISRDGTRALLSWIERDARYEYSGEAAGWHTQQTRRRTLYLPVDGRRRARRIPARYPYSVWRDCVSDDGRYALSDFRSLHHHSAISRYFWLHDAKRPRFSRTFRGHTDNVRAVWLSGDGGTAVSVAADQTLKLWSTERDQKGDGDGLCLNTIPLGRPTPVRPWHTWLHVSDDARCAIVCQSYRPGSGRPMVIRLCDPGAAARPFSLRVRFEPVATHLAADGSRFLAMNREGELWTWAVRRVGRERGDGSGAREA